MPNLKFKEQKTTCKRSLSSAVFLPFAFRLTSKPCGKLCYFMVFTCNKQTNDEPWNAGNLYKRAIMVDTLTSGGT